MKKITLSFISLAFIGLNALISVQASNLSLATKPLSLGTAPPPMMMIVMGRDHTLFYEAYNDATDLDGDGDIDLKFKSSYSYEGYFDSAKCYSYSNDLFTPTKKASTCSGEWSGNFLNYITMTKMDLLRKVLYGGKRYKDETDKTILERAYIPKDGHSWAKSYTSAKVDGYNIADYTPYEVPYEADGKQHFFGSFTYSNAKNKPILRVIKNAYNKNSLSDWGVWNWASTEQPVLSDNHNINSWGPSYAAVATDLTVRVKVCVSGLLEENCKKYEDTSGKVTYKPTGLLHDHGDDDSMLFGLLTGSYKNNLSGGVLRKAVSKFSEELDQETGIFKTDNEAGGKGIVSTINKLKIYGYNGSSYDNCGWITTGPLTNGKCESWGNPLGEMLYESLRYFAGAGKASGSYKVDNDKLSLPNATSTTWVDPFTKEGVHWCTPATNLIISDINPSYDSDQLPGAYTDFISTYNGTTVGNFNVTTLLDTISTEEELSSPTGEFFIGESHGTTNDNAPTAKAIDGLASIRGLAPAEPTKEGSYSSVAVAYYGLTHDLNSTLQGTQNVKTMVIALASSLPEIKIKVGDQIIKIIPFAKSVGGSGISTTGVFQPTNTIVDWYTEKLTTTSGSFRINFEDVEQGADHDMDMIVKYTYEVKMLCESTNSDNDHCPEAKKEGIKITLDSTYAAGGIDQHAGYIISGSNNDALYLEVKDQHGRNVKYHLDTPSATVYSKRSGTNDGYLTLEQTRIFFPSDETAAEFLPSPLQYAAKWGGFDDSDGNNKPNIRSEWDKDGDLLPDTYFPVTNAGELKSQLEDAFDSASEGNKSGTAPVYSSIFLQEGTTNYHSSFEAETWSGDVQAFIADADGEFPDEPKWSAAKQLDDLTDLTERHIYTSMITTTSSAVSTTFEFNVPTSLSAATGTYTTGQITALLGATGASITDATEKLTYLQTVVKFLRGDRTAEGIEVEGTSGTVKKIIRERSSRLGDIINSTPYYVADANGHNVTKEVLVFGANDGMVHIIDADNGDELMAYIPRAVYSQLNALTTSSYTHQYLVNGRITAYTGLDDTGVSYTTVVGTLGTGAKGVYAIDVTNMDSGTLASKIKWEITATGDYEGLGYTNGRATIIKLANGDMGVVFANGYNSSERRGAIYIADLDNGKFIAKLQVPEQAGLSSSNAMAPPAVVDLNSDGVADKIYAGDLYGNMWVFDISSKNTNNWKIATTDDKPLFTATSPDKDGNNYIHQPITTRPSIGLHPTGSPATNGVLVAFGTGKYIETTDNSSTDQATQSFYVIWDHYKESDGDYESTPVGLYAGTAGSVVSARATTDDNKYTELLYQEIINEVTVDEDNKTRTLSTNTLNWSNYSGFYLDLINKKPGYTKGNLGERQVTNSSLLENRVIFTTTLPNDDICVAGGTSWYMEMNMYTGELLFSKKIDDGIASEITTLIVLPSDDECEGDACDAPCEGDACDDPCEGDACTPCEGDACTPCEGDACDTPPTTTTTTPTTTEKKCVTLTNGKKVCFEGAVPTLDRLSWKQLY